MSCLVWNCRGLGNPRSVRSLLDVVSSCNPQIICLLETKISVSAFESIRCKLACKGCFSISSKGKSGGLAVLWRNDIELDILHYSNFHISFLVMVNQVKIHMSLFYGHPEASKRHLSWNLLRNICRLAGDSWIVFGDFNEVLRQEEVSSTSKTRLNNMSQFRRVIQECGLIDVDFKGPVFTYSNRRKGDSEFKARLDRVLMTNKCLDLFLMALVHHLTAHTSDHSPIFLRLQQAMHRESQKFRFEAMWLSCSEFSDDLKAIWHKNRGKNMKDKLDHTGRGLKVWNEAKFGFVKNRISDLKAKLYHCRIQPRTDSMVELENKISSEIDEWLHREEVMWKQRAKVQWLYEGDRNTRFFHAKANMRRTLNTVECLRSETGEKCCGWDQMAKLAMDYFNTLFHSPSSTRTIDTEEFDRLLSIIPRRVTMDQCNQINAPFSADEVRVALFQMDPWKSPGIDGFPAMFYQKCWDIVKEDVIDTVLRFLNNGEWDDELNLTVITLIPKVKNAEKLQDLRPISLVNVIVKIMSKVLVNRIQDILPCVISSHQQAFVKGRSISDAFVMAHELLHYISSYANKSQALVALKLDMSKAYDRLEWKFIQKVLRNFGFGEVWISRVVKIISSVKYKINLNGKLTQVIIPERGLRQGDPLSPYIFILCAEWITYSIQNLVAHHQLQGLRISKNAPRCTHLLYADDSMLFFRATKETIQNIQIMLSTYELVSGQRINVAKSSAYVSNYCPKEVTDAINQELKVKIHTDFHKVKYLGLPLIMKKKKVSAFQEIIDKTWSKISSWNAKKLSVGGKEILIKSVIQAIPQYAMMVFLLPDSTIMKLTQMVTRFWWEISSKSKPIHWVKREVLLSDKTEGGMSFRDFKALNYAFIGKQIWRLIKDSDSLIGRSLKAKYFPGLNITNAPLGYRPSPFWRSVHKVLQSCKDAIVFCQDGSAMWRNREGKLKDYTVKEGYGSFRRNLTDVDKPEASDNKLLRRFWTSLWKIPLPPKIKIFAWKFYHNAIPLGEQIWKRDKHCNPKCLICGFKFETAHHRFFECWWSKCIWRSLDYPWIADFWHIQSPPDFLFCCQQSISPEAFSQVILALWYLWFARNDFVHNAVLPSPLEVSSRIKELWKFFSSVGSKSLYTAISQQDSLVWIKPKAGEIKISCDGSWSDVDKRGGVCSIVRDHSGFILAIRTQYYEGSYGVLDMEILAVWHALAMVKNFSNKRIVIETDCFTLLEMLWTRKKVTVPVKEEILDIVEACQRLNAVNIICIRREANDLADRIAKFCMIYQSCWSRLDACPVWLSSFI